MYGCIKMAERHKPFLYKCVFSHSLLHLPYSCISIKAVFVTYYKTLIRKTALFQTKHSVAEYLREEIMANIVPDHKKNSKNLKQNYRPISLLPNISIFGKIFEKMIYDCLYEHLTANELLNPNQSGFRPNDSTINQLISIVHTTFFAFDCNPPLDVRSVYLDISKAFDRVWHEGLIYKLRRCGISGNLLSLIKDFLANRKQRTVLNGKTSEWGSVTAGVPQGSILGPLFFLVYINNLTDNLKCNVKLFADDTSLFTIVHNLDMILTLSKAGHITGV